MAKCKESGADICKRVWIMNLALGFDEEFSSLSVLSRQFNKTEEEIYDFVLPYIESRDCFKKEWDKLDPQDSCKAKCVACQLTNKAN